MGFGRRCQRVSHDTAVIISVCLAITICTVIASLLLVSWRYIDLHKFEPVASLISVFVGVITFIAVLLQIVLARKQLRIAFDELRLVSADLQHAKTQTDYLNRRADLYLSFAHKESIITLPASDGKYSAYFYIYNRGRRGATDFTYRILIPEGYVKWIGFPENELSPNTDIAGGHVYRRVAADRRMNIYPGTDRILIVVDFDTTKLHTASTWKWQIICEYGTFPEELDENGEHYGNLTMTCI
jgi:hypothetical protein